MKTQCNNCNRLISWGNIYCEECKEYMGGIGGEGRAEYYRAYDEKMRDGESYPFYKSREWQEVRQMILDRDNYLCLSCLYEKKQLNPSNTVHHIKELNEDFSLRIDFANLITVCNSCHQRIHDTYKLDKEESQRKQRDWLRKKGEGQFDNF